MNTRNTFKQAFALGAVVVSIIAIAAILTAPVARAQRNGDTHPAYYVLPPVGITFGQTLRVSFLNVGSNPLEIVPCIFDGDGAHLKTGERLTLAPGQMRSLEIGWSEAAGGRTETRVQMRGAAHMDRSDAKNLVMAGEVVEDAGGRSSLYVPPGTRKGFDPQPDPPAAR